MKKALRRNRNTNRVEVGSWSLKPDRLKPNRLVVGLAFRIEMVKPSNHFQCC
jgi:hypothetical protein